MIRWKTAIAGISALVLAAALLPPSAQAAPTAAPTAADDFANEAPGFAKERGITEAEAAKRLAWQRLAPDLDERLERELGARFGAVWIDQRDGDRVKVGVSGTVDGASLTVIKNATAAVGLLEGWDAVAVKRSLPELAAGNTWLGLELERVNAGAAATLGAGIRTDLNAMQLSIPAKGTLTSAQKDLITQAQRKFGDALVLGSAKGSFQPYACDFPYCDKPLRGGVKITHPTTWCTGGFIAQSKVDSVKYMVTAGHCADGHMGTWSSKNTALTPSPIGPVHHWEWNSGKGDMAIIRIDDSSATGWNPQPWVFVTWSLYTTENTTYHISSDNRSVVGMRICATGVAWGMSNCGHVTELDFTATYGGVTVHELGRTSNCGKPGDSGAPMYASHVAYGILVGGAYDDCDIIYQSIRETERILNVNILH